MAARAYHPHEEVMDRTNAQMHEMLFKQGINWNGYPAFFKRGTFLRRQQVARKFTEQEIGTLPQHHAARTIRT